MAHAEQQVAVPRSGPAVYAFLADLRNVAAWLPAVRHVELAAGVAGAVGAEYDATVDVGGATRMGRLTVTRLDPPTGMAIRVTAAPLVIHGDVTIDGDGDGSRVSVGLDAPTDGLLRLMDGAIQQALQDALAQLGGLADAIPDEAD